MIETRKTVGIIAKSRTKPRIKKGLELKSPDFTCRPNTRAVETQSV